MISCIKQGECVCRKYKNKYSECINEYTISEKGKSIKLESRNREKAIAVVIDQCIIKDNSTKCDALFLYETNSKKYSFLVELKGFGEIKKAFKQLEYTKSNRDEYRDIIQCFKNLLYKQQVIERFVIVTNGMLSKHEQEAYENKYGIRINGILQCEATTPIPDLRSVI